ncbi:pentapeptide repeat-containing protein [Desulfonema magnum]|uniref:Pentapeptide repeat-containing protein n=1 Tax=Desulfonema magnum TaxID=45655 RepID=A0A975BX11_9BACT|nr:pentapeptide repeat-containing protein [Desulfonema magnum]QTA93092.1 Pentapeptide repeat-containing protein [Desulfonema magnum]
MTADQVAEHTNAILRTLASDPLPIDPDLTLWQVYVVPSAKYWNTGTKDKTDEEETKKIPDLIESLLNNLENSADPIVIHGQPGHGKTSAVFMLTHEIVTNERNKKQTKPATVLIYEFKNLGRLDDNEIRVLSTRTPFVRGEDFFYGRNTVLILDGMDERQVTDRSDIALKEFIRHMFHLSAEINQREDSKFNLILTGRSQFVKQVQPSFSADYHLYEIEDFSRAQVDTWLKKYCGKKQIRPHLKYKDFVDWHLEDLIHQPILLTISSMILSDIEGRKLLGNLPRGQISRGDIYRMIIKWTYLKKWQHQPNRTNLPDERTYNQFLRIVAFILFQHGQESIKVGTLIESLKKDNALYGLEVVKLKNDQQLEDISRTLAVSFFFKELEDNAFSFIHKTIKDYLTVEALFDLFNEATEIFRPGRPEKSCDAMASDIYFISGRAVISHEDHVAFLRDVIADRKAEAKELFEPLEMFFNLAQTHVYLLKHENGRNADPLTTEANVLSTLLHWLTEIFNIFSKKEKKEGYADGKLCLFENHDDFYKFICLLNAVKYGNFSDHHFHLHGFNLRKASLSEISLSAADMNKTDLRYANLRYTNLSEANLSEANLSGADLSYANLWGANLKGADLIVANLLVADMGGANLSDADLSGANLSGANLRHANLMNANLSGADLSEADLSEADLLNADLSFIDLIHTDLRDADLGEADLSYANLIEANLNGADLSGANLNGTNLRGANLNGADLSGTGLNDAKELTREQLEKAIVDHTTGIPSF